jgi:tight adherence protein B
MIAAVATTLVVLVGLGSGLGRPARRPRPPSAGAGTAAPARPWSSGARWLTRHRRRRQRDAQLPDALDRLAAALRAGQAPGPALVAVAAEVPDPLGTELQSIARRLTGGVSLADALDAWATRPTASDDVRLAAATITLGAGAGGAVARAVDGVAATLRERGELAAEVRALATQARSSAAVLAVAPIGFSALVAMVEPAIVAFLLTTPVGLGCLAVGGALQAFGAAWMARIVRTAT